jgi:hypothetical protein
MKIKSENSLSRTSTTSMPKIRVGKIRRRPHNRDPPGVLPEGLAPHPTILTDDILKRNSDSKMFGFWKQMSASALEASSNPVGNTTSLRTWQVGKEVSSSRLDR